MKLLEEQKKEINQLQELLKCHNQQPGSRLPYSAIKCIASYSYI